MRKKQLSKWMAGLLAVAVLLGGAAARPVSADNEVAAEDGLQLAKSAAWNEETGMAEITLEAYATGKVSTVENKIPTDVVLVLDESGSMADHIYTYQAVYGVTEDVEENLEQRYFIQVNGRDVEVSYGEHTHGGWGSTYTHYGWYYTSGWSNTDVHPYTSETGRGDSRGPAYQFYIRTDHGSKRDALKTAVKTFIDNVRTDAQNREVDNRIAVVGYATNASAYIGNETTNTYGSTMQSVATSGGYANLVASANALRASGATRADLGMGRANTILNAYANDYAGQNGGNPTRNKVIIMFTDGVPTSRDSFSSTVATDAIAQAKIAKDGGAKVYAAGMVDNLDPTVPPVNNNTANQMNRYMQYLSSNYPLATGLNAGGEGGDYEAGYFLSATNAAGLTEIFQTISGSMGSSQASLGSEAVLKDYITSTFDMTNMTAADISVYTSAYQGKDEKGNLKWGDLVAFNDATVSFSVENKRVDVTGFDYGGNYILDKDPTTGTYRGSKLIVRIQVPTVAGFIGGNEVQTNTPASGIYPNGESDSEMLKAFPKPAVDIGLKYGFETSNQSIYVGDNWSAVEAFFQKEGQDVYKIGEQTYQIDGVVNGYSNIAYSVYDSSNHLIGVYQIPAGGTEGSWTTPITWTNGQPMEDETFKIVADVTPSIEKEGGVEALQEDETAKLHVFTPTVTVSDETIFYGDKTNLNNRVASDVQWKAADENAKKPAGNEPTLSYTFADTKGNVLEAVDTFAPSKDTDIQLVVKRSDNDVDITSATTILNEDGKDEKHDFTIYVVSGALQLSKKIDNQYTNVKAVNANQTFVYRIQQYGVAKDGGVGELMNTFYETISFAVNEGKTQISAPTITGLPKGYYTVTEESEWSKAYDLGSVADTDQSNETEGVYMYIGDASHPKVEVTFSNLKNKDWTYASDAAGVANVFEKEAP